MKTNPFTKWLLAPVLILGGCSKEIPAASGPCLPFFEAGWIRIGPTAMPMMGGFGRIQNGCAEDVAVVGASSPHFADVSLHRTISEDGMSRMRPVPRLEVESGTTAVLEPGGLHLMLMQPVGDFEAGSEVSVTLKLEDGRELPAKFVVQANAP